MSTRSGQYVTTRLLGMRCWTKLLISDDSQPDGPNIDLSQWLPSENVLWLWRLERRSFKDENLMQPLALLINNWNRAPNPPYRGKTLKENLWINDGPLLLRGNEGQPVITSSILYQPHTCYIIYKKDLLIIDLGGLPDNAWR